MSYDTGTQPIVEGVLLSLKAPVGVSSQQLAAVTIQNLSPLTLSIQVGTDGYTLPAYTAHQYTLANTGSPVTLVGTNTTGQPLAGISSLIDAIWFDSTEVSASGTYPAALQPDPLSLGVAIADVLLQQGIPSVLVETVIFSGVLTPAMGSISFDISGFASISVNSGPAAANNTLIFSQLTSSGFFVDQETLTGEAFLQSEARFAVEGHTLFVNSDPAVSVPLQIIGSNRSAISRWDKRFNTFLGDQWALPNAAYGVGAHVMGNNTPSTDLQGLCFLDFRTVGTIVGDLFLSPTIAGAQVLLAASSEMTAFGTAANAKYVGKLVSIPLADYTLVYSGTTAGNGTVTANLVPSNI